MTSGYRSRVDWNKLADALLVAGLLSVIAEIGWLVIERRRVDECRLVEFCTVAPWPGMVMVLGGVAFVLGVVIAVGARKS